MKQSFLCIFSVFCLLTAGGCSGVGKKYANICSPDVKILRYHTLKHYEDIGIFAQRLYAKNPLYEPDLQTRKEKIKAILGQKSGFSLGTKLSLALSHELLAQAFSQSPPLKDRVLLLSLGLKKGIDEAYSTSGGPFLTGCQIDISRLQRLYQNLLQLSWRLKTYKDSRGRLLFITNEATENGYINMGFEVILTRMLTRIQDDIYLRGGLEGNLTFRLGTIFLSIL